MPGPFAGKESPDRPLIGEIQLGVRAQH